MKTGHYEQYMFLLVSALDIIKGSKWNSKSKVTSCRYSSLFFQSKISFLSMVCFTGLIIISMRSFSAEFLLNLSSREL